MALQSFGDWKKLTESKKWEKCPHPENVEYCREYKRFLNGEISVAPNIEDYDPTKKKRIFGHWEGRRGGSAPTRKGVLRGKMRAGTGKYKWRPGKED